MKRILFFIVFILTSCAAFSEDNAVYVLNETTDIYNEVKNGLKKCEDIEVLREIRGVVVSVKLEHPEENYYKIMPDLEKKLSCIEYFLAKIKNPVIIEVHTEKVPEGISVKNWEFSSVIASKIGDIFLKKEPRFPTDRIYTVGYGEFMPRINTSNNGGNNYNRVDIIILSSISGE